MKNLKTMKKVITVASCLVLLIAGFYACKKDHHAVVVVNTFKQVNLVADSVSFGAGAPATLAPQLLNAWGLAANPNEIIWVSANHTGLSFVFDTTGKAKLIVTIPSIVDGQPGAPSGMVYNGTADFGGNKFLFASEDGSVAGWGSGSAAVTVANRLQSGAVYKGITIASDGGANFLYVTNFKGGKIDVFDAGFNYVTTKPFVDPGMPAGFAPFNIQNIGNMLYVTYAKQKGPDNMDDQAGPGNGYVDIFKPDGTFVSRFASQGTLNSPWGIALAPAGFAAATQTILIGNFGDGKINIFDMNGNYKGQLLQYNGQVISIDGLWAIDFLKNSTSVSSTDPLYFTAGPSQEAHGLLGYLKKQ